MQPANIPFSRSVRPWGFVPIGIFFVFGAAMATYAAVTLLFPGTVFDQLWNLNPRAHERLSSLGRFAAIPFLVLGPTLAAAAYGWLHRRRWGWIVGGTLIAINMLGDLGQIALGEGWKGVIGMLVAGLLLYYICRPRMRSYFLTLLIVVLTRLRA